MTQRVKEKPRIMKVEEEGLALTSNAGGSESGGVAFASDCGRKRERERGERERDREGVRAA